MVKIAVIGIGGWGKNHVRALSELNALSAICDTDTSRVETFADKYNVNSYTSIDEMLKNETFDGVIISTPSSTHFTIAKQLMENGINILVPPFINPGDKIVLDTRTLEYVKKIK